MPFVVLFKGIIVLLIAATELGVHRFHAGWVHVNDFTLIDSICRCYWCCMWFWSARGFCCHALDVSCGSSVDLAFIPLPLNYVHMPERWLEPLAPKQSDHSFLTQLKTWPPAVGDLTRGKFSSSQVNDVQRYVLYVAPVRVTVSFLCGSLQSHSFIHFIG